MSEIKLEIGSDYEMTFPNGQEVKCTYVEKKTYPASGMPADYIFEPMPGEPNPFKSKTPISPKFALPEMVISMTTFKLL